MNKEGRIPPLKKLAAQMAKLLPSPWRFPICGLSASVCGLEAAQKIAPEEFLSPDPRFLHPVAEFLGPSSLDPLALARSQVVSVPRGIAWARGATLTSDGRVIDPLSVGMTLPMDTWLLKRQRFFPKIKHVPGTVISLATDGHNNFHHWLLDLFPKLCIAFAAGFSKGTFYLGNSTPFQKQTLDLMGIPATSIIDCNEVPFLQADELVVPFTDERHPPILFNAQKCRLLTDVFTFLVTDKPSPLNLPKRFVVSRSKARSRRVTNEAELMARLEPLGFQPAYLEDLTLAEQITLFAQADAIVATIGAGLVNFLYARPGIPVAILKPEECPDTCNEDMAIFARLRSETFWAEPVPRDAPDRISCDIVLDEALLGRIVRHFTT